MSELEVGIAEACVLSEETQQEIRRIHAPPPAPPLEITAARIMELFDTLCPTATPPERALMECGVNALEKKIRRLENEVETLEYEIKGDGN